MFFNVNFKVFFKLIKVHLLVRELNIYQNARCDDKKNGGMYSPTRNFTTASSMGHFSYPVNWRTSLLLFLKGIENAEKIMASSMSDI